MARIEFDNIKNAIIKANELSKSLLKPISIWKHNGIIYIPLEGSDVIPHSNYVILIKNYDTPYRVKYVSPKSGEHDDGFESLEKSKKHRDYLINKIGLKNVNLKYYNPKEYKEMYG